MNNLKNIFITAILLSISPIFSAQIAYTQEPTTITEPLTTTDSIATAPQDEATPITSPAAQEKAVIEKN